MIILTKINYNNYVSNNMKEITLNSNIRLFNNIKESIQIMKSVC
jgi:hypothetical protein